MPGSTTTRLALYKPDPTGIDNVNVVTDIDNNWDNLDAKVGFIACTSGTRPGAPYNGQAIRETDTGKAYIWNGAAWVQVLYGTAQFANALDVAAGASFTGRLTVTRALAADEVLKGQVSGDTQGRYLVLANGECYWGPGGGSGFDVVLFRQAADLLKTNDSFAVGVDLSVTGATNLAGALNLNGSVYRNRTNSTGTVANTAAETALVAVTLPANDLVVNGIYRMRICGTQGVTGTPTITFRARIGAAGVGGNLIVTSIAPTASTGVTNKPFMIDLVFSVISVGGAGTIRGFWKVENTITVAGASPSAVNASMDGNAATTVDTTVARDVTISAQWSAASASNTVTAFLTAFERIA